MKNKIKELIQDKAITLEDLAQKTGLSKTTMYSIARGSSIPSVKNVLKISKALNVSVEELFFQD